MQVGICGEHGGEPSSVAFFAEAGLDYVSCSPFRYGCLVFLINTLGIIYSTTSDHSFSMRCISGLGFIPCNLGPIFHFINKFNFYET